MKTICYCDYSDTIRQFPENYLLANRHPIDKIRWICEPDLAADKTLATKVFLELLNFDSKYERDGLKLLAKLTPALIPFSDKTEIIAIVTRGK